MPTPDSDHSEIPSTRSSTDAPALYRSAPRVSDPARVLEVARWVAQAGLDKNATDVQIIEVAGRVDYADYLVVMTGSSDRNVSAIAHGVEADLAKRQVRSIAVEGLPEARWVLIDLVDVVAHVFQEDARREYDIDGLWLDAKRIAPNAPVAKSTTPEA